MAIGDILLIDSKEAVRKLRIGGFEVSGGTVRESVKYNTSFFTGKIGVINHNVGALRFRGEGTIYTCAHQKVIDYLGQAHLKDHRY